MSVERQREIREHWLGSETTEYDVVRMALLVDERCGADVPLTDIPVRVFWELADECRIQRFDVAWSVIPRPASIFGGAAGSPSFGHAPGLTQDEMAVKRSEVLENAPRGASVVFTFTTKIA